MDYEQITKLFNFQDSLSPEVFDNIFGGMGEHMWERYEKKYDKNLLTFLCTGAMGQDTKEVFIKFMDKYLEGN